MSSDSRQFSPADNALEEHSLRAQLSLVNRLHIALRASLNPEDLRSIILAVLVSDMGLGFDHSFFLQYDEATKRLSGAGAFGLADADRHATIRQEILDEHRWLVNRLENSFDKDAPQSQQGTALELQDLQTNAFWIEAIQKYSEEKALSESLGRVSFACSKAAAGPQLCELLYSGTSRSVDLLREDLPDDLAAMVGSPAVAAPLRTHQGFYGILIADLGFSRERSVPPGLKTLFEWFALQASNSLQHALLYSQTQDSLERLREIETIKSNFLSTISHELRTPLTAISGFTQLLLTNRAGAVTDRQKEFLQRVQRHTVHLSGIVEDLLELAGDDVEVYTEQDLKAVDPLAALMRVIPLLEHRRQSKQVMIEPRLTGKVPNVLATEKVVERVLFHLLDNAVKFSPDRGQVVVRFLPREPVLRLEIEDQGIGIASENLKKIFEGFFQVDNRLSRSYEGLGIGLTLTKKLLMAIGGAIDVRSRLGEGTTIVVEFRTVSNGKSAAG